jgi:tetratricopeptide (TPR) repeat protein
MSDTELDRAIAESLRKLNSGAQSTSPTKSALYVEAFRASARRKAESVLALLKDGTFPTKQPVFVSVGGCDGEELSYLLEHSTARHGVLLEYSREFAEHARKRSVGGEKEIHVFEGAAQSQIAAAMDHAAKLVRDGKGDAIVVTCHAVIHELYDRGDVPFDAVSFFGRIFQHKDLPTGFTYREPGDVSGWPEHLLVSADCSPESLLRIVQTITLRHPSLDKLSPKPEVIADSVRVHRTLGLELLAKLFYLDDLPHEIEERSTAVDHQLLINAIHTSVGENAGIDGKLVVQTHAGPTSSFVQRWRDLGICLMGIGSDHSAKPLALPEFQKRLTAWRDMSDKPNQSNVAISQASAANYDPQFPPFNVPYSPKRDAVIGRAEGLKRVHDQLTKGRRTAIGQTASFTGLGGLGKTQLAVEYAWEYRSAYPNGVIWIEADQDIDSQLTALAVNARWVSAASDHRYKLEIARKRLRSVSGCLIVFDNVDRRSALESYLPEPGASPHLLITTREPQAGFEAVQIAPLNEEQSLQLLVQEAGRTPETPEAIAAARDIAKRLDGLPLAIEIAGAYLHEMSTVTFDEFLRLLERDPKIEIGRDSLSSFTRHEADLDATLRVSDRALRQQPLLESILDLLTWSGAGTMGTALLSHILKVEPLDLVAPLAFGSRLHLLKGEPAAPGVSADHRYRIHRLVREVRRAKNPIANRAEWVAYTSLRIGDWFEKHRQDFAHLAQYELEFDHLRAWQEHANLLANPTAVRLLWLEAYPAWHRGNYVESRRLLENAIARLNRPDEAKELQGHLLHDLGTVFGNLGDPRLALEYQKKALLLRRELLGERHQDTALSYNNVGNTYCDLGDFRAALEHSEKALSLQRDLLGEMHRDTARSYGNVGRTHIHLGDYQLALQYAEKSLSILKALLGDGHPDTGKLYGSVGVAYGRLGNHRVELQYLEKSLLVQRELLGERHPDTALAYHNVGASYSNLGDHRRAKSFYEKAFKIATETRGSKHPNTIRFLIRLSIGLENNQQPRESFALMQQALRDLPDNHPMISDLREQRRMIIKRHPVLRGLASGHPGKKLRNQKKR